MCKFFSRAYSLKWNLDHISKVIMATLLSKFECSSSSWVGGVLFSNFHLSQMNDAIACMWPAWVPCCESDLPLTTWGSPAAFHCEPVGILAQYMVIWLPMVSPASWIEVGAGGVQRKGCSSDLLSFRCEGSPSSHFTLWPWLLPLSMVPLPCLTWIPGSLCNFLLGSPVSLSLFTFVYFCFFPGLQEGLFCLWAQLCLFSVLKIFINAMWMFL